MKWVIAWTIGMIRIFFLLKTETMIWMNEWIILKEREKETMIWMNNKTMFSIGRILQNIFCHFESYCTDIFWYDK